ncbi:unnamed protein product [Ambrosiozyma monospora]|uniref:Unnamed protein product n=1 Tax=Ambrosiozyma monospora TaxID=43982 RepID=A0ACB5SXA9_AMBMO|nr:unnamed protein product [Ambrosiozyma monospora]
MCSPPSPKSSRKALETEILQEQSIKDTDPHTKFNTAIKLIAQLPLEIQQPILKTALLNYFFWIKVADPFYYHKLGGIFPKEYDNFLPPDIIFWDNGIPTCGYSNLCLQLAMTLTLMTSLIWWLRRCNWTWNQSSLGKTFLRYGCKWVLLTVPEDDYMMSHETDMKEFLPLLRDVTFLKLEIRQLKKLYRLGFSLQSSRLQCLSIDVEGTLSVDFLNSIQKGIQKWIMPKNSREKKLILEPCIGYISDPELARKFNYYEDVWNYEAPSEEMVLEYIGKLGTFINKSRGLNIELNINVCLHHPFCPSLMKPFLSSLSWYNCCFSATVSASCFSNTEELTDFFNWSTMIPDLCKVEIWLPSMIFQSATIPTLNFTNSSIKELTVRSGRFTLEKGVLSQIFSSLEHLDSYECRVSADFFSHLPDGLKSLSLFYVTLEPSGDSVKLPAGLQRLEYQGDSHKCALPLISNVRDLTQLRHAVIAAKNFLLIHGPSVLMGIRKFLDYQGPLDPNFEDFWEKYVVPLKSLIGFRRDHIIYIDSIDFRVLHFPKHLTYFDVVARSVVLDSVPEAITMLCVGENREILVDPSKGETVNSIKNKVSSSYDCKLMKQIK